MKRFFKRILATIMVVLVIVSCAPLQGFLQIDLFDSTISIEASANGKLMGYDFSEIEELVANYNNIADNFNFEKYVATHFTSSPTIDLIEIGMNDATLVAPGFISDLESNEIFKEAYGAWEVSTFIENPGEMIEKLLNRELYYETILFRLLNSSIDSDNAIDWLNQGAIKHSLDFAKSLTDAADWDYSYDVSNRTYLADLSDEELGHLNGLANNYVSGQDYTIIGDGLTFVETAMSVSSSVEEFSGRIGSYLQLANLSESTINFLKILKANTSNNLLSKALDTVITVSNESFVDFMDAAAKAGAVALGKSAIKSFIGSQWKTLLVSKLSSGILSSGYTLANGVLIANSLGQTISNICFSVDKKLDHYELLKALVETETAIKSSISSILNPSTPGTMLSTALDLLYDAYALDCDLCIDLVNIMDKDWIQLSTTAQRNEAKANINTVKNYYSSQYDKILPVRGSCGKNLSWLFDRMTQELVIWGFGSMDDYTKEKAPWYEYKDSIVNIHISSLCSQIGEYAFYGFSKLGTLVFTDIVKSDFVLSEGCFDSLGNNVTFIFTEDVDLEGIQNSINVVVYALGDIYCDGPSYFKEIYVQGCLRSSNILSIAEGGTLLAQNFDSTNITTDRGAHLYLNKNATAEICGDARIIGREHNPFVNKNFDALTILRGSSLTIFGDAYFNSGVFTVKSGSQVSVTGNCLIDGGSITEGTYFYNYGDMYIGKRLEVEGGYCSNSYFVVYGTVVMGDYTGGFGAGDGKGCTFLRGRAYVTDATVEHNLRFMLMDDLDAYLSVYGKANYINGYDTCIGTIELYNDAFFGEPGTEDLNVVFSGDEPQIISGYNDSITAGTFVINNSKGVIFKDKVTSLILFDHKNNPFTFNNSNNKFQDYDGDGMKDDVDPQPTLGNPCTINVVSEDVEKGTVSDSLNSIGGTTVKVSARPTSKYNFYCWKDADSNIVSTASNYTFIAKDDTTLTAYFTKRQRNITVDTQNGTIEVPAKADIESIVTVKPVPAEGYLYKDNSITVNGEGINGDSFEMPDQNVVLSAEFTRNDYYFSLKDVLFEAKSVDVSAYSEETVDPLVTAISNAENSLVSSISKVESDMRIAELQDAMNGLFMIKGACGSNLFWSYDAETGSLHITGDGTMYDYYTGDTPWKHIEGLITTVHLPREIVSIGNDAFNNCTSIKDVYYDYTEEAWNTVEIGTNNDHLLSATLHCHVHNFICSETVDPTCTENGEKVYNCSCGDTNTEEIVALGHSASEWIVWNSAFCTDAGEEVKKCTVCNEIIERREIPAKGHSEGEWKVTKAATCTEDGERVFRCKSCKLAFQTEIIPANGHTEGKWVTEIRATCTEDGSKALKCTACDFVFQTDIIIATGHDYTRGIDTKPTCVNNGSQRYVCIACRDYYDEVVPATGEHKLVAVRKEPTCNATGTEHYECNVCGTSIGDTVILAKLPHNYGEWTVITAPTATEDGAKSHSCDCCEEIETVTISATGFEVDEGVTIDFATNTISGFNAGETSLDGCTTIVNDNYVWEYKTINGSLGTGSKAILKDSDTVIAEYTILIYGDTTGDSWYDGQDAVLVSCLVSGMLKKDDVSETVYLAADCNHDGIINQLDVKLLNQAGTLLATVDQSQPAKVLLETSSDYVKYISLINQTPELDIEDEADADTDTEKDNEQTGVHGNGTKEPTTTEFELVEMLMTLLEKVLRFIQSLFAISI